MFVSDGVLVVTLVRMLLLLKVSAEEMSPAWIPLKVRLLRGPGTVSMC